MSQAAPSSITSQAAQAIIEQAEPRLRSVLQDERKRAADAVSETIPYLAISTGTFLVSTYVITDQIPRMIGYVLAAGSLGLGLYQTVAKLRETAETAPVPGEPSPPSALSEILSSLIDPTTRQMAAAIVSASEPKIKVLIEEERARAANAILSALPWLGLSAASFFGTMFVVPGKLGVGKLIGYLIASGALLFGIHQGVNKELEGTPPPV
jgi:hypothetical protein